MVRAEMGVPLETVAERGMALDPFDVPRYGERTQNVMKYLRCQQETPSDAAFRPDGSVCS